MLNVYVDESCQNAHRFMVLGGICISGEDAVEVHGALTELREQYQLFGELRWTKVSVSKYSAYQAFVDKFFDFAAEDKIHFHSLIVDTSGLDNKKYNLGNREIGFSKFIYQLLIKFGRLYGEPLNCYLDNRTTQQELGELRDILNNGIAKSRGIHTRPYRLVQFRKSKECDPLQITDLLLGAVSSRKNGHHRRPDCNPAKKQLGEYIMTKAGIRSLGQSTPLSARRFTVWNFRLRN